jgi:O-antigen/teichoic acid export membrane protein
MTKDVSQSRAAYLKELFLNQLWQSANFVSKAAFLVILTPLMLRVWGKEYYGLFALSSSLLVSMALLDGGVTSLTRLRLAEALKSGDRELFRGAYSEGLLTFASVVAVAVGGIAVLGSLGLLSRWLNLPAGGDFVLVITALLTGIFMISVLIMQPLAAEGKLSALKAANTWGALVAIPVVAGALLVGASVLQVMVVYSLCQIVPNLIVAWRSGILALKPWSLFWNAGVTAIFRTLRSGVWFYLTTVALMGKTHVLTFVVSAIAGPAEAGIFYILLRLTEIVGNVGATASETSLASLAVAPSEKERAASFRHSWLYVGIFCLHGAVALSLLGDRIIHFWLSGAEILPNGTGAAMALFGLAGAFSRVVVNAAMGLSLVKPAAIANLAEAGCNIVLAVVGYRIGGLCGLFIGGSVGIVFLLFPGRQIARLCGQSFIAAYLKPLVLLAPGLVIAAVLQGAARFSPSPLAWIGALALSGMVAVWQLKRVHSHHAD